jgi:nucleoside-diphosphate-sugar epimerase
MRLLLTGATGYFGSHAARALLAAGHRVAAIRRAASRLDRLGQAAERIDWYDAEGGWEAALARGGVDAVAHAATCYGRAGESTATVLQANLVFPVRLLDAARAHGVRWFVNLDTSVPRTLNAYARSKKQFAEWGRGAAESGGPGFVNLVYEHFYGPGDDPGKFTSRVVRDCLGGAAELLLTEGEQRRDFIYIDDAVSAFVHVVERLDRLDGPVHELPVGSGAAVRLRDFVETVHRLSGSRAALRWGAVPYRPGEPMLSQADLEPLRRAGWSPRVGLEEGIGRTLQGERSV